MKVNPLEFCPHDVKNQHYWERMGITCTPDGRFIMVERCSQCRQFKSYEIVFIPMSNAKIDFDKMPAKVEADFRKLGNDMYLHLRGTVSGFTRDIKLNKKDLWNIGEFFKAETKESE